MPGAQGRASVFSGAGLGPRGGELLPALAVRSLKGGPEPRSGSLAAILQEKKIVATHRLLAFRPRGCGSAPVIGSFRIHTPSRKQDSMSAIPGLVPVSAIFLIPNSWAPHLLVIPPLPPLGSTPVAFPGNQGSSLCLSPFLLLLAGSQTSRSPEAGGHAPREIAEGGDPDGLAELLSDNAPLVSGEIEE